MATKIQIRRGAGLPPSTLAQGELAYDTQNERLYIGTGNVSAPYKEIGGIDTLTELGISATAEELNTLAGIAVDVNDLNTLGVYADKLILLQNVTSDIQTQLNNKIDADHSHGNINVAGELTGSATPTALDYIVISDSTNNSRIAKGIQLETYNSATNKYLKADGEMYNPDATTSLNLQAQESGSNVNILLRGNNEQGVEETKDTLAVSPGQNIDLSVTNGIIGVATTNNITIPKNGAESNTIIFQHEQLGSDVNKVLKANANGLIYNANEVWDRGDFTEAEHQYLEDLIATGVTDTEFDYLDGVTSPIQAQFGGKVSKTGDSMSGPLTMIREVATGASDSTAIEMQYDAGLGGGTATVELQAHRSGKLRFNGENLATENYVLATVVDAAPEALNTLNELAAALGDDANYASTTSTALGNRLRVDTSAQGLTATQKENALANLGVTATGAELNQLDGLNLQTALNNLDSTKADVLTGAATTIDYENLTADRALISDANGKVAVSAVTAESLGYLYGVTSNIQTQLTNKVSIDSPNFTGTPTAPTPNIADNNQIATTAYVNDAISNAGAFTSPMLEWVRVGKLVNPNSPLTTLLTVNNSSFVNHTFDLQNYDYKFVVDIETTAEDNSSPYIRLNNNSNSVYNYVYETVDLGGLTNPGSGSYDNYGGYDQTEIQTGLYLSSASQNVGLTNIHLELTVSQSYIPYNFNSTDFYSVWVKGEGSALGIDAPTTNTHIFPVTSTFSGNILLSEAFTELDIVHNIDSGPVDNATVRVYRRPK